MNVAENIERIVLSHFKVTKEQLRSRDRRKVLVCARHLVWFHVRSYCGYSYPEMGHMYERDHATIIHGARRGSILIGNDPDAQQIARKIAVLLDGIKPSTQTAEAQ